MNKYFVSLLKYPYPRINLQNIVYYSMMDKMPSIEMEPEPLMIDNRPLKKQHISRAMKHHLEKVTAWQKFMSEEKHQFEVGKRHLANMMGRNPETFTQKDIDESIEYLFPSGVFQPTARPMMKPPEEIYPASKEASFDVAGRPHHPFFYTGAPNLYQKISDAVKILNQLNEFEDKVIAGKENGDMYSPIDMKALRWVSQQDICTKLNEKINIYEYRNLTSTLKVITDHPYASKFRDFINDYIEYISINTDKIQPQTIQVLDDGRKKVTLNDIHRKTSLLNVIAYYPGTGRFSIDGKDIHYFQDIQAKEMVT